MLMMIISKMIWVLGVSCYEYKTTVHRIGPPFNECNDDDNASNSDDDDGDDGGVGGSSMLCIQTGTALDWTGGIRGT